jgi:tetratricopeptide (TPR) repeat protein
VNWWIAAGITVLAWVVLLGVARPLLARGLSRESAAAPERRRYWAIRRRRLIFAGCGVLCTVPLFLAAANAPEVATHATTTVSQAGAADIPATLALARHYVEEGKADQAIDQYVAVLRIDGRNTEALASMGYLLNLAGRPDDGLWAVDEALRLDPGYAEAKYFRGAILITGLNRGPEGAVSLREYLAGEPDGNHHEDALKLLDLAGQRP